MTPPHLRHRTKPNTLLEAPNPYGAAASAYAHNFFVGTPLKKLDVSAVDLVGEATLIIDLARRGDPRLEGVETVSPRRLRTALRRYVAAESDPRTVPIPEAPIGANLALIAQLVGLSEAESRILNFFVVLDQSEPLQELIEMLGSVSQAQAHAAVSIATGCPTAEVRTALSPSGRLMRSGMVFAPEYGNDLNDCYDCKEGVADLLTLPDLTAELFIHTFLPEVRPTAMGLDDFSEVAPEAELARSILKAALAQRKPGVNVLLYGPTGTGKTTLATILAREVGARLLLTGGEDDDGEGPIARQRISSLLLGQRLLGGGGDMLLFDEIEDLFEWSEPSMFGSEGRAKQVMSKQWFNALLETNAVPTFWITNRVEGIDAAFLRRFTYAIEVASPGPRQRARVLTRHLGAESQLSTEDTEAIAHRFDASPGQFATAIDAARMIAPDGRPSRASIEQLLAPIDKLVSGREAPAREDFDARAFRLDGLRATEDLARLGDRLAAWKGTAGLTVLLHGEPGTGKSEFCRFLAHRMGRPLVYRRVSDCISKWVGESEKLIAAAFAEAQRDGAVLVFDEADSFLRNREGASQGWEVTQVNEFLQQLESFRGVVVCTTNLLATLDPASLRRFVLKVGFRFAGPEQATSLFSAMLEPLLAAPPSPAEEREFAAFAERAEKLAPGDFAAVARRFRALGEPVSVAECVEALAGEVALKRKTAAAGFSR